MKRSLDLLAGFAFVLSAAIFSPALHAVEKSDSSIFELRRYTTAKGKLPALHKRFRDHTVKLFKKHGMTNVIYWTPTDRPNRLVYLLKHDSLAARKTSFNAFRNDPVWKKAYKESRTDGPLVTKVESTFLKVTGYSPKAFAAAKPGWIYELRTYTTNKGKLANLNARFDDHTMQLFKKHGIHNVLYTIPQDKKRKDVTLVYIIAHKTRKAANTSWKSFVSDPAWRTVARESQKDGRILVKGGVEREYPFTGRWVGVIGFGRMRWSGGGLE